MLFCWFALEGEPPDRRSRRRETSRARSEETLTVRVVIAFGAVDFSLPVNAEEELLVGEEFPPAHVSLEVVVAAPHMAPDDRR